MISIDQVVAANLYAYRIPNASIWLGSTRVAESLTTLGKVGGKPKPELVLVGFLVWELTCYEAENGNNRSND